MARIVFIGVGDVELTRRVASALMLAPSLRGELEIVLHDDDPGRLATTASTTTTTTRVMTPREKRTRTLKNL
ncbi:hypothetical protein AB0J43_52880, partial [Nonomuraea fuscirosea]